MTDTTPERSDRIESAEDALEEQIVNELLLAHGLLQLPDATPSDGPAPAP
ncbi:hypothetical protein KPL76_03580 [Subtercola sp. PAMC28395]|nr:hypothetical protein [Subtercola sp. PAMC28395]QWT24490.1 hypothetical protein KPL76_03580 [Subtercola sp. PAMC28395]